MTRALETLVLVAALVFAGLYVRELRQPAPAVDAALAAELDSLRQERAQLDTIYVLVKDTVWREVATLDTIVDSVEVWKHDTVKVVKYVQRAQATLHACQALVLSCDARVSIRDQQLDAWERRWQARAKPPTRTEETIEAGLWFLGGWQARRLLAP